MFFSVVIPTYNREKKVLNAIHSVLNQSYPHFELIIIDDGSTDHTKTAVESVNDDRISYHKTENRGVAHARNTGILLAKGSYTTFLDSDDLLEPSHFSKAEQTILKFNNPDVVHLNFKWGKEDRTETKENKLPDSLPEDIFNSCSLHVNCTFIRSEIAKKNLFNESKQLMFAEDWDFFIKLAVRYKIHLENIHTAYLIDHEGRNMRNFHLEKWIEKRDALFSSLMSDPEIALKFASKIKLVVAHMNSLISVNLALLKRRKESIHFLRLALQDNPKELFTLRTGAILKHIVLP